GGEGAGLEDVPGGEAVFVQVRERRLALRGAEAAVVEDHGGEAGVVEQLERVDPAGDGLAVAVEDEQGGAVGGDVEGAQRAAVAVDGEVFVGEGARLRGARAGSVRVNHV